MTNLPRPRSGPLTTGPARAPQRAMLRAVGLSEDDLQLPQVAVASSWNEVTPCNLHLNGLAKAAKEGVRQAGAVPIEFGTIAVSDGIAMGHEGMKASLVSREVIADSVELMVHAERFDALVAIAGCDKSLPGMLMACARLNVPAAFLYGGTSLLGGARDGAAGSGLAAGGQRRADRPRPGDRRGRRAGARGRAASARHHDQDSVPQRGRGRDGHGGVDERNPAPARDRGRGPGGADP